MGVNGEFETTKWSYAIWIFLYFSLIGWLGITIWSVMTAIGVVIWLFDRATKT
jgi:hypothetical protein